MCALRCTESYTSRAQQHNTNDVAHAPAGPLTLVAGGYKHLHTYNQKHIVVTISAPQGGHWVISGRLYCPQPPPDRVRNGMQDDIYEYKYIYIYVQNFTEPDTINNYRLPRQKKTFSRLCCIHLLASCSVYFASARFVFCLLRIRNNFCILRTVCFFRPRGLFMSFCFLFSFLLSYGSSLSLAFLSSDVSVGGWHVYVVALIVSSTMGIALPTPLSITIDTMLLPSALQHCCAGRPDVS